MNKKSVLFVIITFILSWSIVLIFTLSGMEWTTVSSFIVTIPFMFTPMVSAIIVKKLIYKEAMNINFKKSFKPNRWFFIAWFLPPLITFAAMGISLLFPSVSYASGMEGFLETFRNVLSEDQLIEMKQQINLAPINPIILLLIQGMLAGITINAIAGFGEELGWREFLYKETKDIGFWKSSLLIGFIWGIWHAPIILKGHNYPDHPVEGVFMMIVWCILLAPVFNFIREKSGSVIAASILHGTINATGAIAILMVSGGNDLIKGITGFSGFIVLIIFNVLIFLFQKRFKNT